MNEWISNLKLPRELQNLLAAFFDPSGQGIFSQFLERMAPGVTRLLAPSEREILGAAVMWAFMNPSPETSTLIFFLLKALRSGEISTKDAVGQIVASSSQPSSSSSPTRLPLGGGLWWVDLPGSPKSNGTEEAK